MAPSAVPIQGYATAGADDASLSRPTKRLRLDAADPHAEADSDEPAAIPPHPLGVKPAGNALTASANLKLNAGIFAILPDELLAQLLEYLDWSALIRLGGTCKALYAFTRFDELWRALFTESPRSDFQWREFSAKWTSKPFILTAPVKEWPVYGKWTTQYLLEKYADVSFRAEAVDWPLNKYIDYMDNSADESSLYLFDRSFVEKMNISVGKDKADAAYWAPTCFGEDLFAVLGDQRPDSRWMIMGPARSGSTFHKDPNATSAWNAVLTGSKYWLMFPSSSSLPPPPGVILSEDSSEITSPLSIAEYLLSFHEIARATPGCREGICYAGEILHVPSGWFHLVLNLEESIALTQNFVPRGKLADVLGFLRDQADQTSGFKDEVTDPFGLFVQKLGEAYPEILEEGMKELEKKGRPKGRGKWEELVKGDDAAEGEQQGEFTFGFGGDEDEEIP
ncbi:hypothetical protein SLS57_003645 [Botryosphaeria dothidea]